MKRSYVYIMANKPRGTLYIGVTSDLVKRVYEHKTGLGSTFTAKYGVDRLVYFEEFSDIRLAIQREGQLKKWCRHWKVSLIGKVNPMWRDLYDEIAGSR